MNLTLLFIHWHPSEVIFGPLRYYGLLWGIGLLIATYLVHRQYKDKHIGEKKFEPLFLYCFFGVLIGARLGHCLFYEPEYYLHHLAQMILPIQIDAEGGWHWVGYRGLASHGGTIGLIVALWIYARRAKLNYMDVLDMIAVATPATACCIRIANLMNSEIIGMPTQVPWAFIFEKVDMQPRHPAQLYEAIAYLIFFFVMWYIYKHYDRKVHRGFFFGLCLTLIFTFRFFVEFIKEDQVAFESGMTLNMGQWLSIPFVLLGVACMLSGKWMDSFGPRPGQEPQKAQNAQRK